jgi:hypothetical protein
MTSNAKMMKPFHNYTLSERVMHKETPMVIIDMIIRVVPNKIKGVDANDCTMVE